jgi:lipopolysaccharide export system permease protein
VSVLKRIDWLVASTVLAAVGGAWAVLVGLDAFVILLGQLSQTGKGNYTLAAAFIYVLWTIPRRMVEMFVYAAAIGGVLGLGALAPTAELTAMRAGGMSKLRISAAATLGIIVLLLVVMGLSETLAPFGEARARALAAGAKSRDLVANGRTGLWAREGNNMINARGGAVGRDGVSLSDVRIFEFDDAGRLLQLTNAKTAQHRNGHWSLGEATRDVIGDEDISSETKAESPWATELDPRLLSVSFVVPAYLSLRDLVRSIAHLRGNHVDAAPYEAAFWARLFYPFDVLALAFASLPFAFGALRSGGLGKRLFLGIMLAVGWFLFQRAMVNVAVVYGVDLRIAHLLPIVILAAGANSYFRRTA